MTEQEREELIEKMARAAWESDGFASWEQVRTNGKKLYLREARAALAVAEPAMREQCARIADITPYAFDAEKDMNTIAAAIRGVGDGY